MHVLLPSSCHRSKEQIVLLRRTRTEHGHVRLTDVCAFRFQGKHNRRDSSNDPVITRILSSTLAEYTRVDERWDKIWTETQSLLTDLSIQLLRQCQIATVINVKKFVTCSIQRKNNWIIFAVSCRDNGNNSSCKGQK